VRIHDEIKDLLKTKSSTTKIKYDTSSFQEFFIRTLFLE